jgi:hypothetical protein
MGTSTSRNTGANLPPSKGRVPRGLPALLALALLMALPSVSWAGNPSLDQYVESVPTGHGGPSHGGGGGGGSHLPASTQRQIEQQGGSDAAALQEVAGSPALGAPAGGDSNGGSGKPGGSRNAAPGGSAPTAAGTSSPSAVDAVTSAATGGGGSAGPWLLVGLIALTGASGAVALARRRSRLH